MFFEIKILRDPSSANLLKKIVSLQFEMLRKQIKRNVCCGQIFTPGFDGFRKTNVGHPACY